jgi:membrane-associated phospholipid phosphatase
MKINIINASLGKLIAALLILTVCLYTQDDHIQRWVQGHKNSTTDHISNDVKKMGAFSVLAFVGLGLYGYIAGDRKAVATFWLGLESFIITGVFVEVLKRTTGRSRPNTGDPHDTWTGPNISGQTEHMSFPSGDVSSAFSVASVVASEYGNAVVPSLVYTAATLIALGRVHNNAHWPSDVFVGAAAGYFTGKGIVASHRDAKGSFCVLLAIIRRLKQLFTRVRKKPSSKSDDSSAGMRT